MKIIRFAPLTACLLFSMPLLSYTAHADDKPRFVGTISVSGKDKQTYPDLAKITFQQVLDLVSKNHIGKIIEVALEKEDGFLVYEVELLSPENTKKEIILDAGTGAVLFMKEKKLKSKKGN